MITREFKEVIADRIRAKYELGERGKITVNQAVDDVIETFTALVHEMNLGDSIHVKSLGKFWVEESKETVRANPRTHEKFVVAPYKQLRFKFSEKAKGAVKAN